MNEKKQIFLIVGLLIVLILVWTLVLRSPSKKRLKQTVEQAEADGLGFKVIIEMADKYLTNKENVQEFSYAQDRDPFSSKSKSVSGEKVIASRLFERLILKGILWDVENPLAIINGEIVGQGETIEGVKIKKIRHTSVIVEAEGQEKIIFIEGR